MINCAVKGRRAALKIAAGLLVGLLACAGAQAKPAVNRLAVLQRGVNLTNWFRYPPDGNDAAIRAYMSDAAIAGLTAVGFTFVRLAVQPEFLNAAPQRIGLLAEAIGRLEEAGLGVVVELHPTTWHLETVQADRDQLAATWQALAPMLAQFDPGLTFPEIVNEPVFTGDIAAWQTLQASILGLIRTALPNSTVVLSGNDWSSLYGLLRLTPVPDGNVIYTLHFYEPRVLVLLGNWDPTVDESALATLPFPVAQPCISVPASGNTFTLMNGYCEENWTNDTLQGLVQQAAQWAASNGASVLMGEFGANHALNSQARLTWMTDVRTDAEQSGLGWALWGYDDVMGFDLHRPPPQSPVLDPGVLGALGLHAPRSGGGRDRKGLKRLPK